VVGGRELGGLGAGETKFGEISAGIDIIRGQASRVAIELGTRLYAGRVGFCLS